MMDIRKKLEYYKTGQSTGKNAESASTVDTPLRVLRDHFNGEIIHPDAPILKIARSVKIENPLTGMIKTEFLSRHTIRGPFPADRCLFFDLETTGLSGGAGTFAFLIGFLYLRQDELHIDQYFLPDFGREYPVFRALQRFFTDFDLLISYNGKSFDLPLFRNRFLLNRMEPPFQNYPHMDLLHIVRRIWGKSYSSCDLQTLEVALNIAERTDDIPGAFIPHAYFNFLNTGTIHDIIRLIRHNYQDLISLFELLRKIQSVEMHPDGVNGDLNALISLAKLAYEEQQERYMERITEIFKREDQQVPGQIKVWQSLLLKKLRKWDRALPMWEELAELHEFSFFALEELAKYHEHIAKDYNTAMQLTRKAVGICNTLYQLTGREDHHVQQSAFLYRSARLQQKLGTSAKLP